MSALIPGRGTGRLGTYVAPSEKPCSRCRDIKPLDAFHRRTGRASGRTSMCKECVSDVNRGRRRGETRDGRINKLLADPFYDRRRNLRRYGITLEQFDAMLEKQGGVCAVCEGPPMGKGQYHVDHCHATGKVRGLLCHKCNVALGMVQDSPALLSKLIDYLELS